MGDLHGERVDKSVTAISKGAAVSGRKFYILESATGPKEAVLVSAVGAHASGVSRTLTDATGEEFELVTEGNILVDAAAAALAIDVLVMSNASGDAVTYTVVAGQKALGISRSSASGGAGETIMLELFATPQADPALL